jgi:outer membrane scaffolding protein for murein synthesis (MipA/OmpV family)
MRALVAVLAALACSTGEAEERPLWELGMGVSVLALPDYRGADQGRSWVLPVPYLVYRGEVFKADRKGVRGELLGVERMTLQLSVAASLPVDSGRNDARSGMPDLKPSLEFGPAVEFTLWREGERDLLQLRLPLRAAFTLESSSRSVGWVATPNLNLDLPGRGALAGWNFGVLAGPVFGDRRQHEYFYSVAPQFATSQRPAYGAHGGYAGLFSIVSLSRRFDGYWVGAFLRADTLRGAVFKGSPLVRSDAYVAGGVAIAWILGKSAQRVEAPE